jgi:hypothetical protein
MSLGRWIPYPGYLTEPRIGWYGMRERVGLAAISIGNGFAGFKERMERRDSLRIYNV